MKKYFLCITLLVDFCSINIYSNEFQEDGQSCVKREVSPDQDPYLSHESDMDEYIDSSYWMCLLRVVSLKEKNQMSPVLGIELADNKILVPKDVSSSPSPKEEDKTCMSLLWELNPYIVFPVIIILTVLSVFLFFRMRRYKKRGVVEESLILETKQEESLSDDMHVLFKRIEKLVEDLPADETGDSFDEKVRKCLSENIANEELTVEKLGQMLGYSRVQLFRKIKEKYNLSPSEYIRKYRLAYALKLLLQEDLRVSEVSFMCGFPDPNRFSKHFSKEFGFPPSAAREHMSDMVNKREPLAGHMDHKVFFDDIIVR